MSQLPDRQGQYARRAGAPPAGLLAAVVAAGRRRRRRVVLGVAGGTAASLALAAVVVTALPGSAHRSVTAIAVATSSSPPDAADSSPTASTSADPTSSDPSSSTDPGNPGTTAVASGSDGTAPDAPSTPDAPTTSPYDDSHGTQTITTVLTGPATATTGQSITLHGTTTWSAERPVIDLCYRETDPNGTSGSQDCAGNGPPIPVSTSLPPREPAPAAVPGSTSGDSTMVLTRAGTYEFQYSAGTLGTQYWWGSASTTLTVVVSAPSSSDSGSPSDAPSATAS